MAQNNAEVPDLTGAEVYVEASRPVAGGRWHILPGTDEVIYERPNHQYVRPAIVSAATLRSSPTWKHLDTGPMPPGLDDVYSPAVEASTKAG